MPGPYREDAPRPFCIVQKMPPGKPEGSMGRMDGCFTAYLTAYSTFDRTISLRAVPSKYDQA